MTVGYDGLRKGDYGVWEWVAFSDKTKFLEECKLWLKPEISINAPTLWENAKL